MKQVEEALREFAEIVPEDEEAFMVLKAQLLAEHYLWAYINSRIENQEFLNELADPYSPVSSGLSLILLAQAISLRDEVPPSCSDIIWPALKALNKLRNSLAHELKPDKKGVAKKMRKFVKLATGEPCTEEKNLNALFYDAAQLVVGFLVLDRDPLSIEDTY